MQPSIDISRPGFVENVFEHYQWMREQSPVVRLEPSGFFAITRYDDVIYVLKNPALFSSEGYDAASPFPSDQHLPASIVQTDPPFHGKLRSLVLRAFTPRIVAALEPRIRTITHELIDKVEKAEAFDLVSEITIPLPMIIIGELLGVGGEKRRDFKRWSDDLVHSLALVQSGDQARIDRANSEFRAYFTDVVAERRKNPQSDLISKLVQAEIDGQQLTADEVLSFTNTLLIAGNETTTSLIGNALVALTDNPEVLRELLDDPELIVPMIEEVLRYYSPAQCVFRLATEDVEISGVWIPKGSVALPLIGSANRDETRFPNAERFDIHRSNLHQIAFGYGIHFCVGAPLARLEAKVALEILLARLGELQRREHPVSWVPSLFMKAPQTLWLQTLTRPGHGSGLGFKASHAATASGSFS